MDSSSELDRPDDDIDLVAAPIRYPRSPLIALLAIALVPTLGLYALQRWADDEADQYEATRAAVAELSGEAPDPGFFEPDLDGGVDADGNGIRDDRESSADDGDVPADSEAQIDALATALFDYRRAPSAVADIASARQLGASVDPVFSFLSDRSCGAVSVGGSVVSSKNLDLPVIPASNQKLIVAAMALEVLGPDHRFTTSVAVPTPVDGVVDGDIFLIGGGDPLLTSDDYPIDDDRLPAFNTTSLDVLADAVVEAGVSRIRGTIIGDGTRYDDEFFVPEWADGIAGVDAGPYDALLANDGRVRGRSSVDSDPNLGAAREFARLLGNRGVRVDNGWGSGVTSTLVPVVGSVQSAPLTDVIAEMLVTSDNNTAEMLVKEIGVVGAGNGSRVAGLQVMLDTLASLDLPVEGVVLNDGSGLSVSNRVTCALMIELLQRFDGTALDDGLPVAGQSGTLSDEFLESPMLGRLRAKTGTLGNEPFESDPPAVKALAGYISTPRSASIEFVMIVNDNDISLPDKYQPLWDAFGERVSTYPSGPDAASLGPR
ncbi:D-alanyl-D-alanine carboxypeptidase/D-alanyl-D-alanine endopeptidase [Ilumatobacter coccineus]|uniref:Putative D-alanyl-D-alanine carboxypeptidase n=1 Tax=Ilumatobacter coccineus (strain NBRC 103263 / KCTC 29153 / YM16-304) TaxID=1313172 RepID=A0A6C7E9A2_ILUCY|nr:D-alanyl-D-alanine carboxypeptidase/D-alanyl-D-alanine-endopeptidase [Ilumatobacter coccineus]BAN02933.1 putative D-alanyl-D-alanine carboxypeptidase [Ilumatobacter coccineus YM16-304]